jgi:divalent metal cation (Fe/Co/Zn/Cd) transporter
MINKKIIASIMAKERVVIAKISKGINHDSTIVIVELVTNFVDVANSVVFIFDKMKK